jgi:putative chitinase
MALITTQQLQLICTTLKKERAEIIVDLINTICPKYGIDTADKLHEFIAQIAHESGEFNIKKESMYYSTPAIIVDVWKSRFNLTGKDGKLNANDYVKNPSKLANTVYSNRMGNGNFESNDGFNFIGGGFLQLTGRESYAAYAKYIGKEIFETANLVRTTDQYAFDSACWEFSIDKKLNDEAENDDFTTITKRINGGLIGQNERLKYYNRAKEHIK